jgi:CheY-like chemotaxis protein
MTNTILLADDSVTIQKVIELTFMDEDYEVVAVGNGDEALDRLEELTPDVVIADVHMPGASGYDVARRAKQLHPQAPVLLLVGTFEPFDEADYQGSGADAYLKKPFDSQELLQRVSQLMEARAGLAAPETGEVAAETGEALPGAAAPEAPAAGDETRFVPTWEERSGSWRPGAGTVPAGQPESLGTRLIPTFGDEAPAPAESAPPAPPAATPAAAEPAAGAATGAAASGAGAEPAAGERQESAWAGWGGATVPEEVPSPAAPSEEGEPEWAAGEPFEPSWEGVGGDQEDEEVPAWSLDETDDETAAAPPPAPPTAAPGHGDDPFPELARPQQAAAPPPPSAASASAAEPAVSGVPGPASPAAAAGDGREVRLSDADVDRVARRLAELLGDQVIREVAWEVVPDLAEVVIKDRLRELESQVD